MASRIDGVNAGGLKKVEWPRKFVLHSGRGRALLQVLLVMPRDVIIIECTEARSEGKPVSRYMSTRNKKTQTERVEKKKYNPHLRRHTLHKELRKAN